MQIFRFAPEKLAIIGLDIALDGCPDVAAFERAIYTGLLCSDAEAGLSSGADRVSAVVDDALRDAGLRAGSRVAVIVAAALDVPPVAQEAARFTGDSAVFQALGEAQRLFGIGEADAALVVGVDNAGVGAVVVARDGAVPSQRVYATVDALSMGRLDSVRTTCQRALAAANVTPEQVGYLESSGLVSEDTVEVEGLLDAYRTPSADLTCALGNSQGAIAGLIQTALCLYRRYLPPIVGWDGPQMPERWQGSPFYAAATARPWILEPGTSRRVAAMSYLSDAGTYAHAILAEPAQRVTARVICTHLNEKTPQLFPLAGDSRDVLHARLAALGDGVARGVSLPALAKAAFDAFQRSPDAPYVLSIVGHDRAALLREIEFAVKGVDKAFDSGAPWSSPQGSYFTAEPLGREGSVAFVYPGAFNSYLGMGRDLFQIFPFLHERFAEVTANASRTLASRVLYPRSLHPLTDEALKARQAQLLNDPVAMIESGAGFAILYTMMMRDVFDIQPKSALGYSLGEISMLWAMQVWRNGDAGSDAWHESPLFKTRLFGPMDAVREYFGGEGGGWHVYILKALADRVRAALEDEPRVYLTIVNEPKEVVIAGDPQGCQRVIAALDCHALQVPFNAVMHNDAMRSEYDAFVGLYALPVHPAPGIDFYSAAEYAPLMLESSTLAHAIAEMSCKPIDFDRLVRTAYDGGARLFVELGPLGTCSRWIRRILAGKPHAVMPINRSGAGDLETILAVLAQLLSHRVPMDVSALYPSPERVAVAPPHPAEVPEIATVWQAQYYDNLGQHVERVAEGHVAFLQARQTALQQTRELILLQMDVARQVLSTDRTDLNGGAEPVESRTCSGSMRDDAPNKLGIPVRQPAPMFDEGHIEAFAAGDLADCFGSMYDAFGDRRVPRIPNGDLMLISRIMTIDGPRGEVKAGASLISEYDVPADAWFYRENGAPSMPYAVLMEIALQPCGFLSAYAGSMFPYPETDFYFRNLDGEGTLLRDVDLCGKTITNRVKVLSSTAVRGIIIQKYTFALACEGEDFYHGTSSFGYFTLDALVNQVGLDGAQVQQPWIGQAGGRNVVNVDAAHWLAQSGRLRFLDDVRIVTDGGQYGRGYVYASVPVDPGDWFFACHFLQDPVMPGSLGVEAMRQAMQVYALNRKIGARAPQLAHVPQHQTQWKYRGQIPPERDTVYLEVNIADIAVDGGCVTVIGDGSLWRQGLRIYEVKRLAIRLFSTD